MESEAQRGYARLLQRLAHRSCATVTSPLTSFATTAGITTSILPSTHSSTTYQISSTNERDNIGEALLWFADIAFGRITINDANLAM
jgi:predicted Zn-dependent peptidase